MALYKEGEMKAERKPQAVVCSTSKNLPFLTELGVTAEFLLPSFYSRYTYYRNGR